MSVTPVIDMSVIAAGFVTVLTNAGITCSEYGADAIPANDCAVVMPPSLDTFLEGDDCWGQVQTSTWPLTLYSFTGATADVVGALNTLTETALTALRDDPSLDGACIVAVPQNSPTPEMIDQGTNKALKRVVNIVVTHHT